jgi:hypothetical protein
MKIEIRETEVYEVCATGVQGLIPAFTEASRQPTGKWTQSTTWQPVIVWWRWGRVIGQDWRLIKCGMRSQHVLASGELGQRAKRTLFVNAGSHLLTRPQALLDLEAKLSPLDTSSPEEPRRDWPTDII